MDHPACAQVVCRTANETGSRPTPLARGLVWLRISLLQVKVKVFLLTMRSWEAGGLLRARKGLECISVRCDASQASGAADYPGWSDRSSNSNELPDQARNGTQWNGNGSSNGVENSIPGSDSASPSQQSPVASPSAGAAASWPEMVMSLPLELSAASAKMDARWLRKRKRKHWWKREQFPRVPSPQIPPTLITLLVVPMLLDVAHCLCKP